jgi:hypothetical protein
MSDGLQYGPERVLDTERVWRRALGFSMWIPMVGSHRLV